MMTRASKLVREMEDENERLTYENRQLKIIIHRLVTKHGPQIDLTPMDQASVDKIMATKIVLSETDSSVQLLS